MTKVSTSVNVTTITVLLLLLLLFVAFEQHQGFVEGERVQVFAAGESRQLLQEALTEANVKQGCVARLFQWREGVLPEQDEYGFLEMNFDFWGPEGELGHPAVTAWLPDDLERNWRSATGGAFHEPLVFPCPTQIARGEYYADPTKPFVGDLVKGLVGAGDGVTF